MLQAGCPDGQQLPRCLPTECHSLQEGEVPASYLTTETEAAPSKAEAIYPDFTNENPGPKTQGHRTVQQEEGAAAAFEAN